MVRQVMIQKEVSDTIEGNLDTNFSANKKMTGLHKVSNLDCQNRSLQSPNNLSATSKACLYKRS